MTEKRAHVFRCEPIGEKFFSVMTKTEEARDQLKTALLILERIESDECSAYRLDSVTWRIADSLLLLGEVAIAKLPGYDIAGINIKTGRNAILAIEESGRIKTLGDTETERQT